MTLLEGVVALVILGLSAAGFLDVFRSGASAAAQSAEWTRVVQVAESAMEAASLGDAALAQAALSTSADGFDRRVDARPWASGVSEVVVTVTSPRGTSFTLHRLLRDRRPFGPVP